MVLHLAVQFIGARSCFIDALIQPLALEYYVRATQCRLLVTQCQPAQLDPALVALTKVLPASLLGVLGEDLPVDDSAAPYEWQPNEVAYVYFTSGTTAEPKGVMLSLGNHANFTRICDRYWQPVTEHSKHLCFVPFSHGFGTIFLVPLCLRTGSELVLLRAFHPLKVLEAIANHRITHLYGVPSHYQQLLRLPHEKGQFLSLEMAFCAASKLEHKVMLAWQEATGVLLCEGYGLIETCCGIVWRVGTPSLGTGHMGPCPDEALIRLAILDEHGDPVPPGEVGQIAVSGPSIMKGYLNMEAETRRVMHGEWFLTGDEGRITSEGELFMTGRVKDIINIAGIKVSPYEVEAVLHRHPGVAEAAVVAAADELYGEVVKAYVRAREGTSLSERDLIRFAAQHLMSFQVPKRVEFVSALPLNNMGKLDRKRLRAENPI
ncbi:MAG: fatty acid--CoA ligase family protein [Polyangiaceae bacterium]